MTKSPASLAYAMRSFVGYLEGTSKAAHTIRSYRSDLRAFADFLESGLGSRPVELSEITRADLERYHGYLKAHGFKTNTRRRKILTVRKMLQYLIRRKKFPLDVARQIPAPLKIERVPAVVELLALFPAIAALSTENVLRRRNRALLWVLAETGCLVSEVGRLRFADFTVTPERTGELQIDGKTPRTLPISPELVAEVQSLQGEARGRPHVFFGFNRFGPLESPISSRGVELLVRAYEKRLGLGPLTPRTFRHSAVVHWHGAGVSQAEILRRLGLRTSYAMRQYAPLLEARAARKPREVRLKDTCEFDDLPAEFLGYLRREPRA